MSPVVLMAIMFITLIACLLTGLPVAFTMGGLAIVFTLIFWGAGKLSVMAVRPYQALNAITLIAMPMFIFMAVVLEKSGVADALFTAMHKWLGRIRGGLGMGVILICTVIAAMSGLAGAGVVMMGIVALPEMLKRKYDKRLSLGLVMAGGTLGILIPPSISFIIYGMMAKVSIGKLFIGGMVPGLILAGFYIVYVGIRCHFQPHLGPAVPPEERPALREMVVSLRGLILPGFLIIAVLGSIFMGLASPTEAAAVGAIGALICAAINRKFSWRLVKESAYRAFSINAMVMWILVGAMCYSAVFTATGGPPLVRGFVEGLEVSPLAIVIIMQVGYLFMGCFLDEITMMMITLPIYFPIIDMLGISRLWFGVLYLVNLQAAYLTPPFGFSLFYMKGVAPPGITMGDIYRGIIPFVAMIVIALVLIIMIPQLALWLPDLMIKG